MLALTVWEQQQQQQQVIPGSFRRTPSVRQNPGSTCSTWITCSGPVSVIRTRAKEPTPWKR